MPRLIDADAFDKALSDAQVECKRNGGNFRFGVLANVRGNLSKAPSVDAAPVVHGCWMEYKYDEKNYKKVIVPYDGKGIPNNIFCSECRKPSLCNGHEEDVASDFCPHCGAKMDLEGLDAEKET